MANIEISQYVVAAITGCWRWESGVNPKIWESLIVKTWDYQYGDDGPHQGGYGLGQWTNVGTPHGRLWDMHEWFIQQGLTDGDGFGQLEYFLVEDYWTPKTNTRFHFQTLQEFLESQSPNLEDLVWDFLACWEGVTGDHYTERSRYAREHLNYIIQHKDDGQTYNWIDGNRYLSLNETLNNVMVVFQNIGKFKPSKKDKKMPLWMMARRRPFTIELKY